MAKSISRRSRTNPAVARRAKTDSRRQCVRRIKIRGENWRIIIGRPPANNCSALCIYSNRTIWIRRSNPEKLQCILHEILHACFPDIDEPPIAEAELALFRGITLLIKMEPPAKCAVCGARAR